jgi:hypothetical protein
MDRRSALVLNPTRLAILFACGGDDGRIDKRCGLDPDRLGIELSGDLVKQRFLQRLSDATALRNCKNVVRPGVASLVEKPQ